jgi:hypothetical protein
LKKKTTTYDGGPPVDKLVAAQALPEPLFSTNDHRRRLKAAASPLPGGVSKTTGFTGGRLSLPSRRSPGCCASRFPLRLLIYIYAGMGAVDCKRKPPVLPVVVYLILMGLDVFSLF